MSYGNEKESKRERTKERERERKRENAKERKRERERERKRDTFVVLSSREVLLSVRRQRGIERVERDFSLRDLNNNGNREFY